MTLKKFAAIVSIITGLVAIIAIGTRVDSRWAKADDVEIVMMQQQQLSMRLDRKILEDSAQGIQNRIWKLEDRYGTIDKMPAVVREEYRQLKVRLDQIYKQLDTYNKIQ